MAEVSSAWVRPKVLVWGGDRLAQDSVEIFDPVFSTWETSPSAQEFREEAASAVINGRLYVCGGDSGDRGPPSTSLDCFDPLLGIWQALPSMSQGRARHAAAVVGAGLYVCGGSSGDLRRTHRSAEVFDTVTNTWQSLPAMVHHALLGRSGSDQGPRVHGRWPRELRLLRSACLPQEIGRSCLD